MPKGRRGSKGPSHNLIIGIRSITAPTGTSAYQRLMTLLEAAQSGDYRLPDGWSAEIHWSNNGGKTWRRDDFTNAMIDSSTYSRGWDARMEAVILNKIGRL